MLLLLLAVALGSADEHFYAKSPSTHAPTPNIGYPSSTYDLGQIAAVDVLHGHPLLFHRGTAIFDSTAFNESGYFQNLVEGPIEGDTLVLLDPVDGELKKSWGAGIFYMPHGLGIGNDGSVWVTDVALHQVFKFPPNATTPTLTLGTRLSPGSSDSQFCQPTDVAVAVSGEVFVADGYCNSRVMKFSKDGKLMGVFGEGGPPSKSSPFAIPHSLTLFGDELCIADREHQRIVCINAGLQGSKFGDVKRTFEGPGIDRVYGVAKGAGPFLYALNGPSPYPDQPTGVTIDINSGEVLNTFSPPHGFTNPHDIAVDKEGGLFYVVEIGPNRLTQFWV